MQASTIEFNKEAGVGCTAGLQIVCALYCFKQTHADLREAAFVPEIVAEQQ
jgi:hypothetical protein